MIKMDNEIDVGYNPESGMFNLDKVEIILDKCKNYDDFKAFYDTYVYGKRVYGIHDFMIHQMMLDRMGDLRQYDELKDDERLKDYEYK